jgi:thioredoxin-related protein
VKTSVIAIIAVMFMAMAINWHTDFVKAKEKAKEEHKLILLNFSGSDWCIPCIRTKKEIFDKESFSRYADSNLVLVNADFPRLKKDELPKSQEKENEALAEKYNKEGAFPLTILLDANGKVVKEWKGYPNVSPQTFVDQIKSVEQCRKTY